MGNFNNKTVNPNSFNKINVNALWKKRCSEEEMTQEEFYYFCFELGDLLSIQSTEDEISELFLRIGKRNSVQYSKFRKEFDDWSNRVVAAGGADVIEPKAVKTRVTKSYEIKVLKDQVCYKKVEIKNPSDYLKTLKILSSDPEVLVIRSPILMIKAFSQSFIQFKISAWKDCEVFIVVSQENGVVEETLKVNVLVQDRPVTPERSTSGNLKKNKSWNFTPRRPSPKRNSVNDL